MSKENTGTQEEVKASQELGTPETEVEISSQVNAGNDNAEIEVIDESSDDTPKDQNDEETKTEDKTSEVVEGGKQPQRNLEAEASKMSKLESENFMLKENQSDAFSKKLQELDDVYRDNPEAYESFRQGYLKKNGVDLGSHQQVYGISGNENASVSQLMQNPDSFLSAVKKIVKEEVQGELNEKSSNDEISAGLHPFWDRHPELDMRKKETVDIEKSQAISMAAASYKQINPNLSWEEALNMAYAPISGEIEKQVEDAKRDGEIIGRQAAMSSSAGKDGGSITSGTPVSGNRQKFRLTESQKSVYDRLLKTKGSKIATNYARLATEQNR